MSVASGFNFHLKSKASWLFFSLILPSLYLNISMWNMSPYVTGLRSQLLRTDKPSHPVMRVDRKESSLSRGRHLGKMQRLWTSKLHSGELGSAKGFGSWKRDKQMQAVCGTWSSVSQSMSPVPSGQNLPSKLSCRILREMCYFFAS